MPVDNSPRPSGAHAARTSGGGGVSKALIGLIAALLVGALVVLGIWLMNKDDDEKAADGASADGSSASSAGSEGSADGEIAVPKGLPADASGLTVGKAGGPELALFEDFQCPACKAAEEVLGDEINKRIDAGELQVTYHAKTFLDRLPGENSERAAGAAFCASDAGKFREYHDVIFANQPEEGVGYTDDVLKGFGKEAGIEGDALKTFESCVDDGTYRAYALKAEAYSNELGVTSTPTYFLNGQRMELTNLEDFQKALDEAGAPKKVDASADAS